MMQVKIAMTILSAAVGFELSSSVAVESACDASSKLPEEATDKNPRQTKSTLYMLQHRHRVSKKQEASSLETTLRRKSDVSGDPEPTTTMTRTTMTLGNGVALCLTGESRTFMMPLVHQSMKTRLVDTLAADVFAVIKKLNISSEIAKDRCEQACDFDEAALNKVLHGIMGAKEVSYVHSDLDLKNLRECEAVAGGTVQLASKETCFDMVVKAELDRRQNYELWVTTRPDLLVTVPVFPANFTKATTTWPKPDFLFGGPRKDMVSWLKGAREHTAPCDADFLFFEFTLKFLLPREKKQILEGNLQILEGNQALVRGLNDDGRLLISTFDHKPECFAQEDLSDVNIHCAGIKGPTADDSLADYARKVTKPVEVCEHTDAAGFLLESSFDKRAGALAITC